MSKVLFNFFNSLEVMFEKQRDKAKLEQKIHQLNTSEKTDENMRSELENTKRLLREIIQVISK